MCVLFSSRSKFEQNLKHVNYLLEKSTGPETDVFPPKLFTFDLRLECLILQWLSTGENYQESESQTSTTYDMPQKILFLVTSMFRLALK